MNRAFDKIRSFFYQSQEFTLWLPGLVLLAVIGYVVLGGIARVGVDAIAWLVELPAWSAWAAAWLGTAWLIQYLYMHDLTREDEERLHEAVEFDGPDADGSRWLLVKARLETTGALILSLIFWWPAR